jgi:hypothetical protein
VMASSVWAVLALTLHLGLSTEGHYRSSLESDSELSALYKDVLLFHWRDKSQHAQVNELEWARENSVMSAEERDDAVDDLINLMLTVDTIVQAQADADRRYFLQVCRRSLSAGESKRLGEGLVNAYRGQYIFSGAQVLRFDEALSAKVTAEHCQRLQRVLASLMVGGDGTIPRAVKPPVQGMAQATSDS